MKIEKSICLEFRSKSECEVKVILDLIQLYYGVSGSVIQWNSHKIIQFLYIIDLQMVQQF